LTTISINQRGIAFSLEASISILGSVLLLYLFLLHAHHLEQVQAQHQTKWQNQQTAIFLTDSLIKNRNETAPYLGSALQDPNKHRVRANELDETLLFAVRESQVNSRFFFTRIQLTFFNGETQTILDQNRVEKNCAAVERVVRMRTQKALLHTVICHA